MTQSRLASLVEAAGNTASGFLISVGVQAGINLAYGLPLAWHDNVAIVSVFTVSSLVRTYAWRRLMQRFHKPAAPAGRRLRVKIIQPAEWPAEPRSTFPPHLT